MIGRTLGTYRIIEKVGMGGMATVYKAYDANTDRHVAVKVLPEYHAKDSEFYERFRREARAIARLEHLNILPVFAYGEEEGIAYLVMRYLPTGTLSDRIRQGKMPYDEISRLLKQIASALDYAHFCTDSEEAHFGRGHARVARCTQCGARRVAGEKCGVRAARARCARWKPYRPDRTGCAAPRGPPDHEAASHHPRPGCAVP